MHKFFGFTSFKIGVCTLKNCRNYIESFFNETLNAPFFKYVKSKVAINKMRIFPDKKEREYSFTFVCFGYALLTLLSWKLLCSLFGFFVREKLGSRKNSNFSRDSWNDDAVEEKDEDNDLLEKKKNNKNKNKNLFTAAAAGKDIKEKYYAFSEDEDPENSDEKEEEEYDDSISFKTFKINYLDYEKKRLVNCEERLLKKYLSEPTPTKNTNFTKSCKAKLKKIHRVFIKFMYYSYQFFAFNKDFTNIGEAKNCFFDDEKIEFLSYYKSIILFMLTFNHIFYTAIILPHRDYFNLKYFTSILFAIFKVSNFSLDCFIVLEAAFTFYKLMCYLKKNEKQSIKSFLYFWVFSIPKIFVFLIIYFFFLIQFKNFGCLFNSNSLFNSILIEKFRRKKCFSKNEFLIFNIFNFCLDLSYLL